jgi:type VI secretion system secreted protein Hcp
VLSVRRTGATPHDVLAITLSDVLVTSYRTHTGDDGEGPVDDVSLAFGQIRVEYRPQQPDGTLGPPVSAGWDVRRNAPL